MHGFRTLHARLALAFAALLLPALALSVLLAVRTANAYYRELTQRQNVELAASLLQGSDLMPSGNPDAAKLAELAKMLAMTNPGVEAYLLDTEGTVLAAGPADPGLVGQQLPTGPIERFLAGPDALPVLGADPRRGRPAVFSAARLPGAAGFLYVVLSNDVQTVLERRATASTALRSALAAAAIGAALLLAGGSLAFAVLTRRLRRLERGMRRFWSGLEARAGSDAGDPDGIGPEPIGERVPGDEIDRARVVFERMAARIEAQLGELRAADRQRRELVSTMSHDLRTPLTALQGSLETLRLRAGRLEPGDRAELLEAAERQAERLRRLVEQLFELSTLDADARPARFERFPLHELAQDLVLKYRPAARTRGVRLELASAPDLPPVWGDIGLLDRALANLIDNALRHTPEGGEVTLALARSPEGVEVAVVDTGEGIDAEALPKVFDRFFQASEARSGGGAGLGLTIAQRVVALHGGRLRVRSEPGDGARFWFVLAAAAPDPVAVGSA